MSFLGVGSGGIIYPDHLIYNTFDRVTDQE